MKRSLSGVACWPVALLLSCKIKIVEPFFVPPARQASARHSPSDLLPPSSSASCSTSEAPLTNLRAVPLSHELHWLDEFEDEDGEAPPALGQSIADGEVVVSVPGVASPEECDALFRAALESRERRETAAARGRSRFSVSDPDAFGSDVVLACDEILLRVLDYLDENVPSVYDTLFWPGSDTWADWQPLNARLEQPSTPPDRALEETCDSLRDLYMMGELEWSEGEPAINVYEGGGYFGAHKDHLALTVLIPLTSPAENFEGGGTGYWSGNRDASENPEGDPDVVLKPPAGSALVFGGDVTHAGMPVESGFRSVFVCSFSTRTPASQEDRLHGMKAPPVTSANFKGTL
mmetsp:Transcript_26261/g.77654  ORF Transcript_26261/g.77654 Transcript_26261/m.77654 type:complete len:348 (-) Transcript_26261:524-1567(-)